MKRGRHSPACSSPNIDADELVLDPSILETTQHPPLHSRDRSDVALAVESDVQRADDILQGIVSSEDLDTLMLTPISSRASLDAMGPSPKVLIHGYDSHQS